MATRRKSKAVREVKKKLGAYHLPRGRTLVLPLDSLHVDLRYQRGLYEAHVRRIMRTFHEYGITILIVHEYEGKRWIVDGQQRREALRRMGFKEVQCYVAKVGSYRTAAEAFLLLNSPQSRKQTLSHERFQAELASGAMRAAAIWHDLLTHGYRIPGIHVPVGHPQAASLARLEERLPEERADMIGSVAALEDAYGASHGPEGRDKPGVSGQLVRVLELLRIWQGKDGWLTGNMVYGLGYLVSRYGRRFTDDQLREAADRNRVRDPKTGVIRPMTPQETWSYYHERLPERWKQNRHVQCRLLAGAWATLLGLEKTEDVIWE